MSVPVSRALEIHADEHDLARHLYDEVDPGGWLVASRDERNHYLVLARAALAWGVERHRAPQSLKTTGYQAGYDAALTEALRVVRKLRQEDRRRP